MKRGVIYDYSINRQQTRGNRVIVSTADIHFGSIDSKATYQILKEQFIDKIRLLPRLDIIVIAGDIFERKYMANSDPIVYGTLFMGEVMQVAKEKSSSVIIVMGTREHDADQLRLFYHYRNNPEYDIHIVEQLQFVYTKGMQILCIPELYGVPEEQYDLFLNYSSYDMVIMHGTIKGSIYGDNVKEGRLFTIDDFKYCLGPIISGHVHTGGCFERDFYYTGSPIRYKFGEENPKGFLILLYDLDSRRYLMHLEQIESFRYDTISIDDILLSDPKEVIDYINNLKEKENIDYLRIAISPHYSQENTELLKNYYRNRQDIKFKIENTKKLEEDIVNKETELYDQYNYIFDPNLSEFEKLARFINDKEGYVIVEADLIKNLLEEK